MDTGNVLVLDLELDREGKRLLDVGAVLGSGEFRAQKPDGLKDMLSQARFVVGHNLVRHDAPFLRKRWGDQVFKGKDLVDTLGWSALLYADRPYHRLVKGYKLEDEEAENNPLSDAKLCLELLKDLVGRFSGLPEGLKAVYHALLHDQEGYGGLFTLAAHQAGAPKALEAILGHFGGELCDRADLSGMVRDHPVELAHALALIATSETTSILPGWVVHELPRTEAILRQLRYTPCDDADCTYCSRRLDPVLGLQEYFGYEAFRTFDEEPGMGIQERAVRSALAGRSLLTVFPTGGGKSLTFQLPALLEGELTRALTVVISPLVSLMKDQVEVLEDRFKIVKAAHLSGLLSPLERQEVLRQVEDGGIHLLYIAPETLRSPTLARLLAKRHIARFVIDEAHCFSAWGHDFRVDYLYIATYLKQLQEDKGLERPIPVSCFTATAKPQVIEDITSYFRDRLGVELEPFISQARRQNLAYEVVEVPDTGNEARQRLLLNLLHSCEKPAIVYASRTKRVEELAGLIDAAGISVRGFHGQMDRDMKHANQEAFMKGEVDVMVATSAFGMGVDKEDVRTVVHYNISNSLESYVQEAGRAGRNKAIQAKCYVLYHEHDLSQHFQLLQRTKLNHKEVQQVWRAIKGLTKFRDRISRSAKELAEAAGWNQEVKDLQNRVAAALAALEDRGYIRRTLNSPQVFATGLLVKDLDTALDLVRSSRSITDRQKEDCARVLQRIIKPDRTGQDIAKVDEIAELLGLKLNRVIDTIQHLRNLKVLNDDQDLSAFVDIRPRAGSRKRYERVASTEKALLEVLTEQEQEVSMRALNQAAMDHGAPDSHPEDVRRLVNYLKRRKVLTTRRVSKANDVHRMALTSEPASVRKDMEVRHELALACLDNLLDKVPKEAARQSDERKQEQRVQFSLLSLKQELAGGMFGGDHTLKEIEEALLYLHHVKVIDLQDGFMVIYQRLNVERTEQNTRKQYTLEDYGHLRHHYQNKVEQIHTVGEYARRRLKDLKDALAFVDDYFKLAHGDFIRRYFPKRETEITRPLTNARFKELFGELDATQTRVVNDASDHILVAAGPGSGKTRVLVHKVASLLLLEDVKPEQFLMLTFSRAAALELRERIQRMVPEYRGLLRVTTFHGLCFELLGQLGDLDKSETVIGRTMEAIRNNEVDVTSIANKSVFVFDEFQDVDAEQWQFIQLLAETAEKPRIIAVGDDDQNIYSFRGASPEFMAAFRGTFKANTHSLLTNYRSRATLVDLTNHLAGTIRNRIKAGETLEAHDKRAGVQRIVEHRGGYHLQALVNAVAKARLEGTTAVLTRTNDEAIMATAMLNVAGIKARYVGGSDDFEVGRLRELRAFRQRMKRVHPGIGLIPKETWEKVKLEFLDGLAGHPLRADIEDLFHLFETSYKGRHDLAEWNTFVREIRISDAVRPEKGVVLVSTMHKSKGKEFNDVFIHLDGHVLDSDEARRLLYVACTRAMDSLQIHTNTPVLTEYQEIHLERVVDADKHRPPATVEYVLGMKEVYLGSCAYASERIKKLRTGDELRPDVVQFSNNRAPGLGTAQGNVLLYSREFLGSAFGRFERNGYAIAGGRVEYIVEWYDKKKDRTYEVVLPRLSLRRSEATN